MPPSYEQVMEHVDHIAARVALCGLLGAVGGTVSALYSGHLIYRSALLSSFSSGMTATACFTSERLVDIALQAIIPEQTGVDDNTTSSTLFTRSFGHVMISHFMGGAMGGAFTGSLYIKRPMHGVAFLAPAMMLFGAAEFKFQEMKKRRIDEIREQKQKETIQSEYYD